MLINKNGLRNNLKKVFQHKNLKAGAKKSQIAKLPALN
jgi:hypothetical protein